MDLAVDPGWRRPRPPAAALRRDVVVGLVATVLGIASLELYRSVGFFSAAPSETDAGILEGSLWVAAITLPLCVRRRFPLTVMVVCSAVFLLTGLRTAVVATAYAHQIGLFAAIYTGGAWARDRRLLMWLRSGVLVVMFGWVVQQFVVSDETLESGPGVLDPVLSAVVLSVGINVLYFGGAWWVGELAWRSAGQRARLEAQSDQLRVASDEIARRAVTDERVRIARELHDVVAHHVSVMGVQAGAARRVLDRDRDAASSALSAVESSSRRAVTEMRQLLGVLRTGDGGNGTRPGGTASADEAATGPARAPQPGIGALDELARSAGDEGLHVDVTHVGEPVPVPDIVQLSLYRSAQEALSNVRRHSTARTARVVLRFVPAAADAASAVELEVLDDGRPSGADPGSGLGHTGMKERAAMHGGEVEVGRRPFGGYRVRVRYPVAGRE